MDLIGPNAGAFVCEYHRSESRDLTLRRQVLSACRGGRLGVLDAVELVISTSDLSAARSRWQQLLNPLQPDAASTWRPPIGPAITLVEGDDERVDHLALAVRSTAVAERAWRQAANGPLEKFPIRFVESATASPAGS